jgi:hypothetical protein
MGYLGRTPTAVPIDASDIPANSITSDKIKDGVITVDDIGANAVGNSEMADDAVGVAELSATGTASSSTYLRGDNSWATIDALPSQSTHSGKYLTTNGSAASWSTISTVFPFFKADGTSDTITITNGNFPFFKADGSADNIGVS